MWRTCNSDADIACWSYGKTISRCCIIIYCKIISRNSTVCQLLIPNIQWILINTRKNLWIRNTRKIFLEFDCINTGFSFKSCLSPAERWYSVLDWVWTVISAVYLTPPAGFQIAPQNVANRSILLTSIILTGEILSNFSQVFTFGLGKFVGNRLCSTQTLAIAKYGGEIITCLSFKGILINFKQFIYINHRLRI